jgi:hypothetical protein
MRLRIFLVCLISILIGSVASAQDEPPPVPERAFQAGNISIELYFERLKQGRAGLVHIFGEGITDVEATFFDTTVPMFMVDAFDGFYGFVAADMDLSPRTYELNLNVTQNGRLYALPVPIDVINGGFIQQDVIMPPDKLDLIAPGIEDNELNLITTLSMPVTPERMWGNLGFIPPVDGELTSPFGAVRTFNVDYNSRHTGWDFNGDMGSIMRSTAAGRVAFSGPTDIRGGYVLIDHGYGVYSGYAHLSVIHVVAGQRVGQGQIIGLAGNTGRSSDPHLHIEMLVNGLWVDPVDFINMWVP